MSKLPSGPLNQRRPQGSHTKSGSIAALVVIALVFVALALWHPSNGGGHKPGTTSSSAAQSTNGAAPNDCVAPNKPGQTCDQTTTIGDLTVTNHVMMISDSVTGQLFADRYTYPTVTVNGTPTVANMCAAAAKTMAYTGDYSYEQELKFLNYGTMSGTPSVTDSQSAYCGLATAAYTGGDNAGCYQNLEFVYLTVNSPNLGTLFTKRNVGIACGEPNYPGEDTSQQVTPLFYPSI
ncbi:MAG: hypothetical protein ACQR33_00230 [Candidatus Saccharibacteria bacterium]